MLYEIREAVIKLFNDYFSIVAEAKYKAIHKKGDPSDSALLLKILTSKQMLQRLQIAFTKLKQVTHMKTYWMKSEKSYIFGIKQKNYEVT